AIAHWMGAAPRQRGSSEAWTLTHPSRGAESTSPGSMRPYAATTATSSCITTATTVPTAWQARRLGTAKGGVPKNAMRGGAVPCSAILEPVQPRPLGRRQRGQRRPAVGAAAGGQHRLHGGELLVLAAAERIHGRVELGEDVPELVVAPQRPPAREAALRQPAEL